MLSEVYSDYIFKVDGEDLKKKPQTLFHNKSVYLIIDKELKIIWIWAGRFARLFHRYIGANWAGKIKNQKPYHNFRYELIKQGHEPPEFLSILKEIDEERSDLEYPGQSRTQYSISEITDETRFTRKKDPEELTESDRSRVKKIILEIKEIQMHVKYTIEHIQRKIIEIEKILVK